MTLAELIALFREEADDTGTVKPLWSNTLLTAYANEAEVQAARRARLLVDSSTAEICNITVGSAAFLYALDRRVIFVRRARIASQSLPLTKIHRDDLDNGYPGWEDASAGTPRLWCPNYETGKIVIFHKPDAADTLRLRVVRTPLEVMEDGEDEPEIAPHYHAALVHWMIYRAFSKQDSETNDTNKAKNGLGLFELEFGPASRAIDETWISGEEGYDEDGSF